MPYSHRPLLRLLAPSLVAIGACLACLCGLSWAIFTSEVSTGVNTIQSASFAIEVSVKVVSPVTQQSITEELSAAELDADEEEPTDAATATPAYTVTQNEDGTYTVVLPVGNTYTITIKNIGTATTGYCLISIGGNTYCTAAINVGEYTLTITPAEEKTITITPTWGPVPEGTDQIASGTNIDEPSKEDTPQEGNNPDEEYSEVNDDPADQPEDSVGDGPLAEEQGPSEEEPPSEDSQPEEPSEP